MEQPTNGIPARVEDLSFRAGYIVSRRDALAERLDAIENHQRAQLILLQNVVNALGDIVTDKAERVEERRQRQLTGTGRHLHLVRDE